MNAAIVRLAREKGCRGCACWAATGSGEQAGECRIAPPRTSANHRWPVTSPSQWCAEWIPLEEAAPADPALEAIDAERAEYID